MAPKRETQPRDNYELVIYKIDEVKALVANLGDTYVTKVDFAVLETKFENVYKIVMACVGITLTAVAGAIINMVIER